VLSGSKPWAAGGRRLESLKPLRGADGAERDDALSEFSGVQCAQRFQGVGCWWP